MIEYTNDQKRIIEERDKSLLVSAAAGSGKTTVLVERIIGLITHEEHPIDIDRLLICTFTREAASQMREKIYKALRKLGKKEPQNPNIARQIGLLSLARISTIDSFCQGILKNYFAQVGMDPDYSLGDEGALKLIKSEVMDELLEEEYGAASEDFIRLADTVIKKENDKTLREMIEKLCGVAEAYPWPLEYLESLKAPFMIETPEELRNLAWYRDIRQHIVDLLSSFIEEYEKLAEKVDMVLPGDPHHYYYYNIQSDLDGIGSIMDSGENLFDALRSFKFVTLSSKKVDGESKEDREIIKKARKEIKDQFEKLGELAPVEEEVLFFNREIRPLALSLIQVSIKYYNRLVERKYQKKALEFSDVEHLALNILVDKDTKKLTETGRYIRESFDSVFVDEYQDSNELQELILSTVSGEEEGRFNYFMVGDVKQSIYRFRKARPDIFLGKQIQFKNHLDEGRALINLSHNFRSRRTVTESVNRVFCALMKEDLGGIDYQSEGKLIFGAEYYGDDDKSHGTELIYALKDDPLLEGQKTDADELEALMLCHRIRELMTDFKVREPDGSKRDVEHGDIVILHRSANAVAPTFKQVFEGENIPLKITGTEGYFASFEVETLLSILKLINNPYDDIALVTVLTGIYDADIDSLAKIRAESDRDKDYCRAFYDHMEEGEDTRFLNFKSDFATLRDLSLKLTIPKLINAILKITGFENKVLSMPAAQVKLKNIEKLKDLAISFGRERNPLLYEFLNYIEDKIKFEVELAAPNKEGENAIRLMTIHKSKGLEFPVCIVAGLGKQFNTSKSTGGMIISEKAGIAFDYIDRKRGIKVSTAHKKALKRFEKMEETAEGERILYVALTRAKEKLILSAVTKESEMDSLKDKASDSLSLISRLSYRSYYPLCYIPLVKAGVVARHISLSEITDKKILKTIDTAEKTFAIEGLISQGSRVDISGFKEAIEYGYQRKYNPDIKAKYSVSQLKNHHMELMEEESREEFLEDPMEEAEFTKRVPSFLHNKQDEEMGRHRGIAVHRFMECCDFTDTKDVKSQVEALVNRGILSREEGDMIPLLQIAGFFESTLAKDMERAQLRGDLFKEKTFVMEMGADELSFPKAGEEKVLIQGVIDAFYIEDDGIVLLDYKTDKVNNESVLKERYKSQLDLYARALERAYSLKVKAKLIYSFSLGKTIEI